jgi:NADH-quinone oxidoreductase subunit N
MLAYSSIAHAGYLLAAFAGAGSTGIAAACFYTAAYAAMNVGVFAVISLVSGYNDEMPLVSDFRGLLYRSPVLGSLLLFFIVSLVGIPFTGGFFGKFYSFSTAIDGGAIALAIIGLLNSGLAAGYYLRLAATAAQRDPEADPTAPGFETGILATAALFLAVAATLVLGMIPGSVLNAAQAAAHTLQAPPAEVTAPSSAAIQASNPAAVLPTIHP